MIDYYVLSTQENGGFFRKNQELPRILLQAAIDGHIQTYEIDYSNGNVIQLSLNELSENLRKLDEPGKNAKYSANDLSLIGIDLTEGHKDGEIYRQYHFLNLYVPYHHSATTHNVYIASLRFDQVIDLLIAREILWYPESFGLANGIFTNYAGHTLRQTGWAKDLLEQVKYDFSGASFSESANISSYDAYKGYEVDIHLKEKKENGHYRPQAIEIHKARHELKNGENPFICSIPYGEFREYLGSRVSEEITLMSDALLKRKLTSPSETWQNKYENFYDANFRDQEVISKNGKYHGSDQADPLSAGKRLELRKIDHEIDDRRFALRQVESVELLADEGTHSVQNQEMIQMILNAARMGDLSSYRDDSLKTQVNTNEFKEHPIPKVDFHRMRKLMLGPIYELSFDNLGRNKSYRPLGLGIIFPEEDKVSAYFRFEDLKEILPDKQLDFFINRDFKGFVSRSSHISMLRD